MSRKYKSLEELGGHVVYNCGPSHNEIGYRFFIPIAFRNSLPVDLSRDELLLMLQEIEKREAERG